MTGIGVISPLGNGADEFFARLSCGQSGIGRLPSPMIGRPGEPAQRYTKSHVGAAVSFDAASVFASPRLRMLDRGRQLAGHAAIPVAPVRRAAAIGERACGGKHGQQEYDEKG